MSLINRIIFINLLIYSSFSHSHPVSFQGATSINSYNSPQEQDFLVSYSYKYWASIGLRFQREAFAHGDHEYYFAQTHFLAKRWNNPESQGNIYLGLGAGEERRPDSSHPSHLVEIQADWESRKIYTMASYTQINRHNADDNRMHKQRLGYAPFLGEFNELNIWAILERKQKSYNSHELNQWLRFYYKNVLWEIGASSKGEALFNFMVHN